MIEVKLDAGGLTNMRFASSPICEVIESLYMLHTQQVPAYHRPWVQMTRDRLRRLDHAVLEAVVPARGYLMDMPLGGVTIERQLQEIANWPPELLRSEMAAVWRGTDLPPAARQVIANGAAGPGRVAHALWDYWDVALRPYWSHLQAVLDTEMNYRALRMAENGISALMADLHPQLQLSGQTIRIAKQYSRMHELTGGGGLLLIPCVFAWPNVLFSSGTTGPAGILYGPRGVGSVWDAPRSAPQPDDALGALIGRSRAAILRSVKTPRTTTELARELAQSAPTVSMHLSTLKKSGMVISWRSGRRVLYQRTALATSILSASSSPE